ncbi:hypothetical protein RvY_02288 [Ramazzottius varieornatus]|uniref:Uncharacterized protein n=1 Tax=Ramazzottius varieornatus TaxID=947166 RepID=A0A1D1URA2_RAMVA|nr:hypothetical protein RvY_02288 [Ramazzottius varieornatus]
MAYEEGQCGLSPAETSLMMCYCSSPFCNRYSTAIPIKLADGSLSNSKFEVSEGEAPRRSTAPAVVPNQESGVTQSSDIIDNPDSSGKPNAGSEIVGSQAGCETRCNKIEEAMEEKSDHDVGTEPSAIKKTSELLPESASEQISLASSLRLTMKC